jgi:hypothetical protein
MEDGDMKKSTTAASLDHRVAALEHQVVVWRRAAACALVLLALGGTMAFRQLAPGPIEASSLTLHGQRGTAVTLSLRPSGDLEARFKNGTEPAPLMRGGSGFSIVNPEGREVLRLGSPSARQLAP